MKERVKELRKKLGLTLEKFGEKLGVTKQTISRIENGVNSLTEQMLKSICREFNVNEEWLRNGTGEMFSPAPSDALYKLKQDYNLSESDYVMVEKFVSLRPEARQIIFDYMQDIVAAFAHNGASPHAPAYGNESSLSMDDIFNNHQEYLGTPGSVAAAEAAYEKSLGIVPKEESIVLNTTDGAKKRDA